MYTAADLGVCASCNHQCYAALWKRYFISVLCSKLCNLCDDGHGVCVIDGHGGTLFKTFPFAYTMYTVRATGFQHRLLNAAGILPIHSMLLKTGTNYDVFTPLRMCADVAMGYAPFCGHICEVVYSNLVLGDTSSRP